MSCEAPGKTVFHLAPVHIDAVAYNVRNCAAVAVDIDLLKIDRLASAQLAEVAPRDPTFLSTLGVLFPAIVIARLVGLVSSRS